MSTEAAVAISLEALQEEIIHLKAEIHTLTRNQSSRMGLTGARGERGEVGPAGKDAVLKFVHADGKVQIVDLEGRVQAELITVPGPRGADAAPAKNGVDGHPGRDGKDAPSLEEIVRAVLREVKTRL